MEANICLISSAISPAMFQGKMIILSGATDIPKDLIGTAVPGIYRQRWSFIKYAGYGRSRL